MNCYIFSDMFLEMMIPDVQMLSSWSRSWHVGNRQRDETRAPGRRNAENVYSRHNTLTGSATAFDRSIERLTAILQVPPPALAAPVPQPAPAPAATSRRSVGDIGGDLIKCCQQLEQTDENSPQYASLVLFQKILTSELERAQEDLQQERNGTNGGPAPSDATA